MKKQTISDSIIYKFINPLMPVPAVTVKKIGIYTPVICDHSYIN